MAPAINMISLLQTLENFYLSSLNQQVITVILREPFNDYIYINAIRESTFNQTCFEFLTTLNLYMSKLGFLNIPNTNNKILVNGLESLKSGINHINNINITKYKTTFNMDKATITYNPNP